MDSPKTAQVQMLGHSCMRSPWLRHKAVPPQQPVGWPKSSSPSASFLLLPHRAALWSGGTGAGKAPSRQLVCSRDGASLPSFISDPEKAKEEESVMVKDHKGRPEGWPASSGVSWEVRSVAALQKCCEHHHRAVWKTKVLGFQSK